MKIYKRQDGKFAAKMNKQEWLKIGQQLGLDTSSLGTGGMGQPPEAGSGAVEDVNSSPDLSGVDSGVDDSVVSPEGDDLSGGGEDPLQKIRRLVGELQSALDEYDGVGGDVGGDTDSGLNDFGGDEEFDPTVDDTAGLGDSADLGNVNPADQVL